MSRKQTSEANGISAQAAQEWARQTGQYLRARQLAAQAQLAPVTANARIAAQQGMLGARTWTAPQLERLALALQEQVAPQVAAALAAAARRIEPPRPARRRWPAAATGAVVIAVGAVAAVIIMNRRNSAPAAENGEPEGTAGASEAPSEMTAADTVGADVNGQTQAP